MTDARADLATATGVFERMGKGGAIYLKSPAELRIKIVAN